MKVFPSYYIHIGGDEAPKDLWKKCTVCQEAIRKYHLSNENELQGYMINQLRKHVELRGRRLICWDEAVESNADKNVVIQWWRHRTHGEQHLIRALNKGHQVIASPNSFAYLSFPVNSDKNFYLKELLI